MPDTYRQIRIELEAVIEQLDIDYSAAIAELQSLTERIKTLTETRSGTTLPDPPDPYVPPAPPAPVTPPITSDPPAVGTTSWESFYSYTFGDEGETVKYDQNVTTNGLSLDVYVPGDVVGKCYHYPIGISISGETLIRVQRKDSGEIIFNDRIGSDTSYGGRLWFYYGVPERPPTARGNSLWLRPGTYEITEWIYHSGGVQSGQFDQLKWVFYTVF